jgi:hypothetical protein
MYVAVLLLAGLITIQSASGVDYTQGATTFDCVGGPATSEADHTAEDRMLEPVTTGTSEQFELQKLWWNWNRCTGAFNNANFTPMDALVPDNTLFLAGIATDTSNCSKAGKRVAPIGTGNQTVLFPLVNSGFADLADDWVLGLCSSANSSAEQEVLRFEMATASDANYTSDLYKSTMYARIDGQNVSFFYLYDPSKFYLATCPGGQMCPEDACDTVPITGCEGIDNFPNLGYWGMDTREWADGETHVFEFGGSLYNFCIAVEYTITANKSIVSPTSAPTKQPSTAANAPTKKPTIATSAPAKQPSKTSSSKKTNSHRLSHAMISILSFACLWNE